MVHVMEKLEDNLGKILSGSNTLETGSTVGEDASPADAASILFHGSYIAWMKYFHKFNLFFQVPYFPL